MIGRLAALILLSTLSQTTDIRQPIPLTVAELGDNMTLTCQISNDVLGLLYWYKLNFGYMVQTIAEGSFNKISLKGQFNNSRFNILKQNSLYFFNINNVSKDDEATYLCQAGAAYTMKFMNGTVLAVKEHKRPKSAYVKQSPETKSVRLNDSVTLQCSLLSKNKENRVQCPGEHSVYWFRAGSGGSPPAIVHTHRNSSDKQDERSCVYSLSKTIRNSSDTGTYYCAVVTCGEILFGEGTQIERRKELCPFVIVLGTLLACSVILIVALIISRNQWPVFKQGDITTSNHADHPRTTEDQPSNEDGEAVALNYVALDFSRKRDRRTNNRELPQDCVYSGMRVYESIRSCPQEE